MNFVQLSLSIFIRHMNIVLPAVKVNSAGNLKYSLFVQIQGYS